MGVGWLVPEAWVEKAPSEAMTPGSTAQLYSPHLPPGLELPCGVGFLYAWQGAQASGGQACEPGVWGWGEKCWESKAPENSEEGLGRGLLFVQNSGIKCTCGGVSPLLPPQ